jgi:hypothetical protein
MCGAGERDMTEEQILHLVQSSIFGTLHRQIVRSLHRAQHARYSYSFNNVTLSRL